MMVPGIDTYYVEGIFHNDEKYFESGFDSQEDVFSTAFGICKEFDIYVRYNNGDEEKIAEVKNVKLSKKAVVFNIFKLYLSDLLSDEELIQMLIRVENTSNGKKFTFGTNNDSFISNLESIKRGLKDENKKRELINFFEKVVSEPKTFVTFLS